MGNGNDYVTAGSTVPTGGGGIADDLSAPGADSARDDGTSGDDQLVRLAEQVRDIAERLDALIAALVPLPEAGDGKVSPDRISGEIETAKNALVYAEFLQAAIKLGMSPGMVPDAYLLADLTDVTADLETKKVVGITEALDRLLETKPYLFQVRPVDVGSETNPPTGASSYPPQVESLAIMLGVSPAFAVELVKKRSGRAGNGPGVSEIWRMPRTNRLSYLETNE